MKRFSTNDVRIYDRWSHRSYAVNRRDVNVAKSRKFGDCMYIWVRDWSREKTPGYSGMFAVYKKTWDMITKTDRRTWK